MKSQIKHFPRHLAKYLFDNIDKGLIQFQNLQSEIHFYSTYDTSSFYDLLIDSDVKFIMNLYSVSDWDYKITWDDLLDRNGKVQLSIFTLNSFFDDEREYYENKLGDKEYILEYNKNDGMPDIIVDKKELSPQYIGYLLDELSSKLPWSDVQFIPELPPNVEQDQDKIEEYMDTIRKGSDINLAPSEEELEEFKRIAEDDF